MILLSQKNFYKTDFLGAKYMGYHARSFVRSSVSYLPDWQRYFSGPSQVSGIGTRILTFTSDFIPTYNTQPTDTRGDHYDKMGSSYLSVELAEKLRVQIQRPSVMQDTLCVPSEGVVGYGEGVVYLTSPGRPTDIGLQSGKACCHCSR